MMACAVLKLTQTRTRPNFLLKCCPSRNFSACKRYFSKKVGEDVKNPELKPETKLSTKGKDTKIYSSSEKSEDISSAAKTPEDSREAAKKKLLSLLSEIKVSSDAAGQDKSNLNLAKPLKRPTKKERFANLKTEHSSPQEEIENAVKAVASTFKENSEEIETELTKKLSSLNMSKEYVIEAEVKDENVDHVLNDEVNKNLMSSVEEVASTVSGSPPPQPKSELTRRLLRLSLDTPASPDRKKSMMELFEGMKIQSSDQVAERSHDHVAEKFHDHGTERPITDRKKFVKQMPSRPQYQQQINIFDSPPLGVFSLDSETKKETSSALWQKLQEKELSLLVQYAPTSAFEEMILWTEQGKHWKFPIDNEINMGVEENIGFNEHVFLEQHLHGFPTKGPIRHFMELVVVGLSKNPYITVDRKIENIDWFRNYFKEKEEILTEAGAIA